LIEAQIKGLREGKRELLVLGFTMGENKRGGPITVKLTMREENRSTAARPYLPAG
jgi:hypothetical protein